VGAYTSIRKFLSFCVCIKKDNSEREKNVKANRSGGEWSWEVEERILIGHWNSKAVSGKGNKINY
jgi:hypothetical protein